MVILATSGKTLPRTRAAPPQTYFENERALIIASPSLSECSNPGDDRRTQAQPNPIPSFALCPRIGVEDGLASCSWCAVLGKHMKHTDTRTEKKKAAQLRRGSVHDSRIIISGVVCLRSLLIGEAFSKCCVCLPCSLLRWSWRSPVEPAACSWRFGGATFLFVRPQGI